MPDLNSLPVSPKPSTATSPTMANTDEPPSHPLHSPSSHSLAAAAALNAGLHNEDLRNSSNGSLRNPRRERRRSSIRMSLNFNDPAMPGPGELQMSPGTSRSNSNAWPANPSHQRNPSLGELHQELESEQENQVNRLLHMIRQQQTQIQALQSTSHGGSAVVDDSTPPTPQPAIHTSSGSRSRSPFIPHSLSRHSSYRSNRSSTTNSPSIIPMSGVTDGNELHLGPSATRDESAFYQAETQTLTRENQMLKLRIRELERQLLDTNPTSPITHSPVVVSPLVLPPITPTSEDDKPSTIE
ncbi:Protein transport protein [Venturia nashicola]|nr:Protein transport protein [Venturia nashicola]